MYTALAIGAVLALTRATPLPNGVVERDVTYNCLLSAIITIDETFTVNAGANAPGYSQSTTFNTSIVAYGSDGSSNFVWSDNGKTQLLGNIKNTDFTATETGLAEDVNFSGSYENGWQYCNCQYGSAPQNHSTDFSQASSSFFLTNDGSKTCNCGFSCGYPGPKFPTINGKPTTSGEIAPPK